MKARPLSRTAIVLAVLLALALTAVALTPPTLAQQIQIALGFDPDTPTASAPAAAPAAGDIQPDEDGYSGPLPPAASGSAAGVDAAPRLPSLDAFDLAGQPDSLGAAAPEAWSDFKYFFAAGSSLHSADYTTRSDYQPGACIAAIDAANQFFTLNLDLPQGARIDYLRLFYYDTNASDGSANIRVYPGDGNYTQISTVASTSNTGFGTTLSGFVDVTVDNLTGSYVLNWLPQVTGSTMQLCGLRVAYRLPQ